MKRNMIEGFHYWGAFEDDLLVGLISIKKPAHLYNLFVHTDYHRRGIARQLWDHVLAQLKPESVTVYSSSYAVDHYRKLGFRLSGGKIANDELICYSMLWTSHEIGRRKKPV